MMQLIRMQPPTLTISPLSSVKGRSVMLLPSVQKGETRSQLLKVVGLRDSLHVNYWVEKNYWVTKVRREFVMFLKLQSINF